MKLKDALFNWLQIKVVSEARPEDKAALDTYQFFSEILREDHHVTDPVASKEEDQYVVRYLREGKEEMETFDAYLVDLLLMQIESEPKYNQ